MFFAWCGRKRTRTVRPRGEGRARRPGWRPCLEPLEERWALSDGITVPGAVDLPVPTSQSQAGSLALQSQTFSAFSGFAFTNPVAAVSGQVQADIVVLVDWGDGHQSQATLSASNENLLQVVGSHTYRAAGEFTVTTTVTGPGQNSVSVQSTALVLPGANTFPAGAGLPPPPTSFPPAGANGGTSGQVDHVIRGPVLDTTSDLPWQRLRDNGERLTATAVEQAGLANLPTAAVPAQVVSLAGPGRLTESPRVHSSQRQPLPFLDAFAVFPAANDGYAAGASYAPQAPAAPRWSVPVTAGYATGPAAPEAARSVVLRSYVADRGLDAAAFPGPDGSLPAGLAANLAGLALVVDDSRYLPGLRALEDPSAGRRPTLVFAPHPDQPAEQGRRSLPRPLEAVAARREAWGLGAVGLSGLFFLVGGLTPASQPPAAEDEDRQAALSRQLHAAGS